MTKDWTIRIKPDENLLPWILLLDISSPFLANKSLSGLKIKLSGIIQWRTNNANTINNRRQELPFLHNDGLHWTKDMKRKIIKWFSKIIMIMLCTVLRMIGAVSELCHGQFIQSQTVGTTTKLRAAKKWGLWKCEGTWVTQGLRIG